MESSSLSILYHIHQSQSITRQELSEQIDLGASRISTLVSQLIADQLVQEEISQDGSRGRPVASLSINPRVGRVVALDIGGEYTRAVLTDLTGQVLLSRVYTSQAVPDREIVLRNITHIVQEVCQEGGTSPKQLAALGVGLRALVNTQTGVVLGWPNTPAWETAWRGLDVLRELESRLGTELIVVDDVVRAMAMTAYRSGPARHMANFFYVFLGSGIGSAIFVDGRPYRGSIGLAGELGHGTVDENGPWCRCGNRGCLESLASTSAVLRRVQERLAQSQLISTLREPYEKNQLTLVALIKAACAGDKLAFQILDETGTYIGQMVSVALNLLGVELVVLGGPLAQDGGIILEAVQRQIRLRALQYISHQVRIVYDDQNDLTGAQGMALVALEALFGSKMNLERFVASLPGV